MHLTIPLGKSEDQTPRKGRFAYLAERVRWQKLRGLDKFA